MPGIRETIGYCESCKSAWYTSHRETIRQHWQRALDAWPTPSYVYGLLDPRDRSELHYIGRAADLDRRIREHRKANDGTPEKRAWIADLHEQGLTFEYCILSTALPGYHVVELEARWIGYAIRHRHPLTNKERQEVTYDALMTNIRWMERRTGLDVFTCPIRDLPCGDRITVEKNASYAAWTQKFPSVFPHYFEWGGTSAANHGGVCG